MTLPWRAAVMGPVRATVVPAPTCALGHGLAYPALHKAPPRQTLDPLSPTSGLTPATPPPMMRPSLEAP